MSDHLAMNGTAHTLSQIYVRLGKHTSVKDTYFEMYLMAVAPNMSQ